MILVDLMRGDPCIVVFCSPVNVVEDDCIRRSRRKSRCRVEAAFCCRQAMMFAIVPDGGREITIQASLYIKKVLKLVRGQAASEFMNYIPDTGHKVRPASFGWHAIRIPSWSWWHDTLCMKCGGVLSRYWEQVELELDEGDGKNICRLLYKSG